MVIVALPPDGAITQSVINALDTFVQSGNDKRVVLVGEWSPGFADYNGNLNTLAAGLGMNSRFGTDSAGGTMART